MRLRLEGPHEAATPPVLVPDRDPGGVTALLLQCSGVVCDSLRGLWKTSRPGMEIQLFSCGSDFPDVVVSVSPVKSHSEAMPLPAPLGGFSPSLKMSSLQGSCHDSHLFELNPRSIHLVTVACIYSRNGGFVPHIELVC